MKNLPKIFLALSIIAFAIGCADFAENILVYMGRPVGAIFFVLFMIFQFLKQPTALYDEEQERNLKALGLTQSAPLERAYNPSVAQIRSVA